MRQLPVENREVNCSTFSKDFLNEASLIFHYNIHDDTLLKYIKFGIKRLNLYNIEVYDVLTEAIIRGVSYINKNQKAIENPRAWLRITASHILLEKVREIKHHYQLDDEFLQILSSVDNDPEELSRDNRLFRALSSLPEKEKTIITLRIFHNKSYAEISKLPSYQGYRESVIRKSYSRAIKKLKHNFSQLSHDD
jgi:RNA polymerase sigma factor (sigma-70 family)